MGDPELIVLDEPTVGLDPVLRIELWELFREIAAAGTTMLVSSHVMDEALRCDRLVLLREGQVIADTTPAGLLESTGAIDPEAAFLALIQNDSGKPTDASTPPDASTPASASTPPSTPKPHGRHAQPGSES